METERPSPRFSAIDVWSPSEILDAMVEGQFAAVAAVHAARPAIERAALAVEQRLVDGGRLVYAGAGTSGRLAVQDGAELIPTFSWPRDRLLLFIAGGQEALIRAVEGAEDEIDQAIGLVRRHELDANDVMIAVAASGTTSFTVACLRSAKERGALTIGIANNRDTPLLELAEHPIWLNTGSETIAGSTRMKAGTAQRSALVLLSSLVMIRLGRIYDGLMVDLQVVNKKLALRSENILSQLTGCTNGAARDALLRAEGSVKLALLVLEGCEVDEARAMLDRTGGRLRAAKALAEARKSPLPRHSRERGCNPIGSAENGGEILSDYERCHRSATTHGRTKRRIQMGFLQRFRENRWFLATRSKRRQLDYILESGNPGPEAATAALDPRFRRGDE